MGEPVRKLYQEKEELVADLVADITPNSTTDLDYYYTGYDRMYKQIRIAVHEVTVDLSGTLEHTEEMWFQIAHFLPVDEFYMIVSRYCLTHD